MVTWRNFLHQSNLTPSQIRKIPGSSSLAVAYLVDLAVRDLNLSPDQITRGLEIDWNYLHQTDTWLDPLDDVQLTKNVFQESSILITHNTIRDWGKSFELNGDHPLALLYQLMPAEMIIRDIHKNLTRFNNYMVGKSLQYERGKALIQISFYPFYQQLAEGTAAFFSEGVLSAVFRTHGIRTYKVNHLTIGFPLMQIIKGCYSHLKWKVDQQSDSVWINGKLIAKPILLVGHTCKGGFGYFPQKSLALKSFGLHNLHESEKAIADYVTHESTQDQSSSGTNPLTQVPKHGDSGEIKASTDQSIPPHGKEGQTFRAWEIVEDFFWEGQEIFTRGQIFDAPSSLYAVTWQPLSLVSKLRQTLGKQTSVLKVIEQLDNGITTTTEKYFQAAEALRSNIHQSKILQAYTKRVLSQQAMLGEDPTKWKSRRRHVAVLFCDVRKFTNLSERLTAEEVVTFLNEFFGRMNGLISLNNGEIDKLMGDSVMAQFSTADDAVQAAVDMNRELQNFNRERFAKDLPRVDIGIGISWGEVIQGNIGTQDRLDYTIVGDTVNIASRLESLTRSYQVQCIISEELLNHLSKSYKTRFLDRVQVKGKLQPVGVYEMYESDPDWLQTIKQASQPLYDLAYRVYEMGDFARAVSLYARIYRDIGPHSLETALSADPVVLFYMDRARQLRDALDAGEIELDRWTGIYQFAH
jgi:class 3 adenylate cyclase